LTDEQNKIGIVIKRVKTWLAEKLGKSYNMVNGYVQNRKQPSLDVLHKIVSILDSDVRELIVSSKND